ncbi:MAG: hypothetical protein GX030_10150 [Firmicutes bacterium]|nr:hypothetical protein [Bacillota bacterium]
MAKSKSGGSTHPRRPQQPWHRVDARLEASRELAPNTGEGVDAPSIRESGATKGRKSKRVVKPEPTS